MQTKPFRCVVSALTGLLACLGLSPLRAADFPGPTLPDGLGVNIHFTTGHDADLDGIAAAGFRFIRMDLAWGATEHTPGKYDWSKYDALTAALEKRGLRALYILDYGNRLYEPEVTGPPPRSGPASPQHPESIAAFARWAAATVAHFAGHRIVWEIYNEPNVFWIPSTDAAQYVALAVPAARAMRDADPQATILAPASSRLAWDFLDATLTPELLGLIDGVSVHPYRDSNPEHVLSEYPRLRTLIDARAPAGHKNLPIISSEWGYQTSTKGVPVDRQGDYLAREFLVNQSAGINLSIWYDWINDGKNPAEPEENFGLLTQSRELKPSHEAVQSLTAALSGYQFVGRDPLPDAQDFALRFRNARQEEKLAVWTTGKPHPATLAGGVVVELAPRPKYLAAPVQP